MSESLWRLASIELVNWGSYDGYHRADIGENTTLISGDSGTGKSTLLDAYTAVMMDHRTRFNGASNASRGRVRGEEDRSIRTYVRGLLNANSDPRSGQSKHRYLRFDHDSPATVISLIALSFCSDSGERCTGLRLITVSADATSDSAGVSSLYGIVESRLDVRALYDLVAGGDRMGPKKLESVFGGSFMTQHSDFIGSLGRTVGITARDRDDDGRVRHLLSRIQAGSPANSIAELYRRLVFEEPSTFAAADSAAAGFEGYLKNRELVRTTLDKLVILDEIEAQQAKLTAEGRIQEVLEGLGAGAVPSKFHRWTLVTTQAALRDQVDSLKGRLAMAAEEVARVQEATVRAEEVKDRFEQLLLSSDVAAQIERFTRDVAAGRMELSLVERARADFDSALEELCDFDDHSILSLPSSAQEFDQLRDELGELDRCWREQEVEQEALRYPAHDRHSQLKKARDEAVSELASLRDSNVSPEMVRWRDAIGHELGMADPARQLPFVAELMEIAPDQEDWLHAAEIALRSFANDLLVTDASTQRAFDTAAEKFVGLLPPRVFRRSTLVDLSVVRPAAPITGQDMLSGKLVYAEGPLGDWVKSRVQTQYDHVCVPDAGDLRADGRAMVSRSGVVRKGVVGMYGTLTKKDYQLGLNARRRREYLEGEIARLTPEVAAASADVDRISARLGDLRRSLASVEALLQKTWSMIDAATPRERLKSVAATLAELEQQQSDIVETRRKRDEAKAEYESLVGKRERARGLHAAAEGDLGRVVSSLEQVREDLSRYDAVEDRYDLNEEEADLLSKRFAQRRADARDLPATLSMVSSDIVERLQATVGRTTDLAQRVCDAQGRFLQRWPAPDLGSTLLFTEDFLQMRQTLKQNLLPEVQREMMLNLLQNFQQPLVNVTRGYIDGRQAIVDRIDSVNRVLADVRFGVDDRRIRIAYAHRESKEYKAFKREANAALEALRAVQGAALRDADPGVLDKTYTALERPMRLLGVTSDATRDREQIKRATLDVRDHIDLWAEEVDPVTGEVMGTHVTFGSTSGGEVAELTSFVVGAALRCQLAGDDPEVSSLPRYRTVIVDEAFIKADREFTGRSVNAWLRLGFQLITGSTEEKAGALSRGMDSVLLVKRGADKRSRLVPVIKVGPDEAAELLGPLSASEIFADFQTAGVV